jgi:hypothetical protein
MSDSERSIEQEFKRLLPEIRVIVDDAHHGPCLLWHGKM